MTANTAAEQRYQECIAPIRGVAILGFERIYDDGTFDPRRISLISKTQHSWDEIDDWQGRSKQSRLQDSLPCSLITHQRQQQPYNIKEGFVHTSRLTGEKSQHHHPEKNTINRRGTAIHRKRRGCKDPLRRC